MPDELITRLVLKELKTIETNWLLDGYPRTLTQAKSLASCIQVTQVIDLHVPHEEILNRIKGRWIHLPSGRVYNTVFKPPKVAGKDDVTGEDLVQREDDKYNVVKKRLQEYQSKTDPILEYYKKLGILKQFTGDRSDMIYADVKDFLRSEYFSKTAKSINISQL